jgi:quinol-cytochrome oxidoreductase complex cytochrome b subunit
VTEEVVEENSKADEEPYERPFLPNHILDEIGVVFLVAGVVLIFASLRRPEQLSFPHVFFAGVLEMMDTVSPLFGALVILAVVVLLVAMPFLDRSEEKHPRKRLVFIAIIFALIAFWAAFTIMGF